MAPPLKRQDWKWVAWKARFYFVLRLVQSDGQEPKQLEISASSVIDFQAMPTLPSSSFEDESASRVNIACCAEILLLMAVGWRRASSELAAAAA